MPPTTPRARRANRNYVRVRHVRWHWANAMTHLDIRRLGPGVEIGRIAGTYFVDVSLGLLVGRIVLQLVVHSAWQERRSARWRREHGHTKGTLS